ncbi:MAG: hypothetical protein IJD86_14210 [Clostridia bacterium]|nr:hypothetical protein [Clostridia bacterium]
MKYENGKELFPEKLVRQIQNMRQKSLCIFRLLRIKIGVKAPDTENIFFAPGQEMRYRISIAHPRK